jgi:dihydrofolate reductase
MSVGKIVAEFTMSLDGFIAGPNDEIGRLFPWYGAGDTAFPVPSIGRTFMISRASADLLGATWGRLGALVTGRRDFDVSNAWGGKALLGVPTFIVTHRPPPEWDRPDSPFTFVTDGVASAVARARQAAGDRDIGVGGTTIVRQCLRAGLLDEIQIHLAPVLLGVGIRLFDGLGPEPIDLETIGVIAGTGVTHLRFRVIKGPQGGR